MDPLVLSVLYVWCQVNKDMIVQFWFGMQFKVEYFIFFLVLSWPFLPKKKKTYKHLSAGQSVRVSVQDLNRLILQCFLQLMFQ